VSQVNNNVLQLALVCFSFWEYYQSITTNWYEYQYI